MKKILFFILTLVLPLYAICQIKQNKDIFNFDFETIVSGSPIKWGSNLPVIIDSLNPYHGKYSVILEINDSSKYNYQMLTISLPHGFKGKTITLSGYMKTENVRDGYAGLWMRIDPNQAFDILQTCKIAGTTDWTKYEITLPFDSEHTTGIIGGGGLNGKGKIWLDNFSVMIDGVDIYTLLQPKAYPADRDTVEFKNGSGITNIKLNKTRIKNLKDIGMIWGFLKYYHPAVRNGNYNWDYELFRLLPQVINEKNKQRRDAALTEWISGLGEIFTNNRNITDTLSVLKWIDESGFSPELTAQLIKIKKSDRQNECYYVNMGPAGNPVFNHEKTFDSMKYPDTGYRLLSLYRYWNMVQYFYPYKNIIGKNWENVLAEFIPRFAKAENEEEYVLAAMEITAGIHDSHAILWTPSSTVLRQYFGQREAVPKISFIEQQATVTAFYNDTLDREHGLKIGDVITKIDGKSINSIIHSKLPITAGSNYQTQLRNIARQLLHNNDETIKIKYIRDGCSKKTTLKTFPKNEADRYFRFAPSADSCIKKIAPNIAYLYPGLLKKTDLPLFWKAIKDADGLIIDLRYYPSNYLLSDVANYLIPEPKEFVKFFRGSIIDPGSFSFTPAMEIGEINSDHYKGKVIILVNEGTQSSMEFSTMALSQAPDARVIGSTTAGADGDVSYIDLPGGIKTMITGLGVFYPDGGQTQRIGIKIDEVITPTLEGIKAGRDEILEQAVEVINE
ncbi:S41 family peptidase [Alistipes hominis]|uniref:Peptidase S41 n=1 Tax=Alistipes hominis TaxID=2763015 RepID=A0ABR7CPH6_9BACT|nr:S41 family peptidase [Alistipes hominis]MBC5617564.1 peptidase S41 [Alistipes hominis]